MIAVIGAGAAGLMAAIAGADAGADVLVVERTRDGGRKILISGGGRCNVLPSLLAPERFVTASPAHRMRGLLRGWPLAAQRAFFERDVGIPLKLEPESGKLFPISDRARDVRDGLVALAERHGTTFRWSTTVTGLARGAGGWRVETDREAIDARAVILATGGLSVPSTGSDGIGLRLAESLGHEIHTLYPALTPLVSEPAPHANLAGVSLSVRLRAKWRGATRETTGGILFTHHGYSGPAVLDISDVAVRSALPDESGAREPAVIRVSWAPLDADAWRRELAPAVGLVVTAVARYVPRRLAERLVQETGIECDLRLADLPRHARERLIENLTSYVLPWTADEGYRKAEVTGGGVSLDEVDPRTLESRRHPGLFLCGEMLDAFGPIGGHNFAWAWATGRTAGLGAARSLA